MIYHVLNGDALIDRFLATELPGEPVVCREGFVEGSLAGDTLNDFFDSRIRFYSEFIDEDRERYVGSVIQEFNKILSAPHHSEFNLWFGYDLFCRVNMFFIISLLYDMEIEKEVYIVNPAHVKSEDIWKDFGRATVDDLGYCFSKRRHLNHKDLRHGNDMWFAYKNNDLSKLARLSQYKTEAYPYLEEVIRAHIDRFPKEGSEGRPEKTIREIIRNGGKDFNSVFVEFFKREGIYGFGDTQVQKIYNKVVQELGY
jgi:hypothetical protein